MFTKQQLTSTGQEIAQIFHLGKADARVADRMFSEVRLAEGSELASEGSHTRQLVIILDGEVEVLRDGSRIAVLSRGDILGEITTLGISNEQTASAVALTDVRVAVAGAQDVAALTECTALYLALQSTASRRLVGADRA